MLARLQICRNSSTRVYLAAPVLGALLKTQLLLGPHPTPAQAFGPTLSRIPGGKG